MTTGLTSPQFHVKFDPTFQTLRKSFGGQSPPSGWQAKCGFTLEKGKSKVPVIPSEGAATAAVPSANSIPDETRFEDALHVQFREAADPIIPPEGATEAAAQPQVVPYVPPPPVLQRRRQSTRTAHPPSRLVNTFEVGNHYVAYETLAVIPEPLEDHPLVAFTATSADPDTMYLHEAMREPDKEQFLEAMEKEVSAHTEAGNFIIVPRHKVPQGVLVIPAVWQMKRKRRISTREVYKWKARLNFDGSKQVKGVNYWETYAPVASWSTIRFILAMSIISNWHTKQLDFVLAFPQADVECDDMYMKIPRGFNIPGSNPNDYVLKLQKNLYGQKQAGRVWNKHLVLRLKKVGFKQSDIDECVFYKGKSIYVLYTDDSILAGPDEKELDQIVRDMKGAGLDLTVEGDISDFLGVKISRQPDGSIHLTQPHLIDQIISDLWLDRHDSVSTKMTPAAVSQLLRRCTASEDFDGHFKYRSVIGKLNYLEKTSRPDISYAVHQCARFSGAPKKEHAKALKWLGRYLIATRDKGLIFNPKDQSFDCHVDADFAGAWDKEEALEDPDTARSRSGFIISYANCPIIWTSKLQTTIALSSTEAEYVSLSLALRDVIPLMGLVKEMQAFGFDCHATAPKVHCRAFEDNSGALEMATVHKSRPRTKHINVGFHHFRSFVNSGAITIHDIDTTQQRADIMTKSVNVTLLQRHRMSIMGW
jgi:hypothetical protein